MAGTGSDSRPPGPLRRRPQITATSTLTLRGVDAACIAGNADERRYPRMNTDASARTAGRRLSDDRRKPKPFQGHQGMECRNKFDYNEKMTRPFAITTLSAFIRWYLRLSALPAIFPAAGHSPERISISPLGHLHRLFPAVARDLFAVYSISPHTLTVCHARPTSVWRRGSSPPT